MKPTEHEMTVAVDAAARHVFEAWGGDKRFGTTFDELPPLQANELRENALGPTMAALEALPDRAESTLVRIGTYLTNDMWCHHERCLHMKGEDCSCGLDELLEQLAEEQTG